MAETTDTPKKVVIHCGTGEVEYLPLTAEEIASREASRQQYEAEQAAAKAEQEALEASKAAAIAKLTALGLTEDEALALAGN